MRHGRRGKDGKEGDNRAAGRTEGGSSIAGLWEEKVERMGGFGLKGMEGGWLNELGQEAKSRDNLVMRYHNGSVQLTCV